jgi:hypothetical protein
MFTLPSYCARCQRKTAEHRGGSPRWRSSPSPAAPPGHRAYIFSFGQISPERGPCLWGWPGRGPAMTIGVGCHTLQFVVRSTHSLLPPKIDQFQRLARFGTSHHSEDCFCLSTSVDRLRRGRVVEAGRTAGEQNRSTTLPPKPKRSVEKLPSGIL